MQAGSLVNGFADFISNFEKQKQIEISQLKDEIHQLQQQLNAKNKRIQDDGIDVNFSMKSMDEFLQEIDETEQKYNGNHPQKKKEEQKEEEEEEHQKKTAQFWSYLDKKLKEGDIEYVKELVRNKEIKMDEVNDNNRNLLMLSTFYGSFELVSMCINLGADIDKQDKEKKTALKIAQESGFPDIEELLLMNLLKTELGQRIENTTNALLKKKAITRNFNHILNELFSDFDFDFKEEKDNENEDGISRTKAVSDTFLSAMTSAYKDEVLETLNRITLKCIEKKTAFSDDILYIAIKYEINQKQRRPTNTTIYKTLKKVILEILSNTKDKPHWFWLRKYVLSSSIWYIKVDPKDEDSNFLWYNLFEWVEEQSKRESILLSEPMRDIESKDLSNWNRLIHYDINTKYDIVRQDKIDHGLKAEYTKAELTENISLSGSFNPITHYDLSQYLTKLILISHEYDDMFQSDIHIIFDIDKESKHNSKLGLQYKRGPVKKYERCYAKCQSDYRDTSFPTSAHVLDIVRCTLIFDDVSGMLSGMDVFQSKMNDGTLCIKDVVRIKNGFQEYSHDNASYTDIKFNVIVSASGKKNAIIAEVQFMLKRMDEYKKIAHSLYSIQRTKEFVDDLKIVLPIKTNLQKQLFISAARNNIDGLCDLMVSHNFDHEALLQLNQQKQSILTPICAINCEKALQFLIEIETVPIQSIKRRLMLPDQSNKYPLLRAITNNHYNGVLKIIFENDKDFGFINLKDHQNKTSLERCWEYKRGKAALLILQNILSLEKCLETIDSTIPGAVTTLQYALWSADYDCVAFIFEQLQYDTKLHHKLLCAKDAKSLSNFHYACRGGNVKSVQLLLKHQNKERHNALYEPDVDFQAPAFFSVMNGKAECTDFVLSKMSDKQKETFFATRNRETYSPIGYIERQQQSKEHMETLSVMVKHLKNDSTSLGRIWLFAARHNQIELAESVLNKITKADYRNEVLNYLSPYDNFAERRAMHACCYKDNRNFLQYLLNILSEDHVQYTMKNASVRTPLMIAAAHCHITCCQIILNKIKDNTKLLQQVLEITDTNDSNAIQLALDSNNKNNEKCAKKILSYYDDTDLESVFLPCLSVGNIELAKKVWHQTKNNQSLQNKLLNIRDKNQYNCFLLVCKKGRFLSLEWLLSLNDDQEDEAKEDERNITQKHPQNGKTCLILSVEHDVRSQKELTDQQKENYEKCVKLMLSKVQNKKDLLFEFDNEGRDAFMYAARNGNIEVAMFLLDQINDKNKKALINRNDKNNKNCFDHAVSGGNFKLVRMIYEDLFIKYQKHKQIMNDSHPLSLALQEGYFEIVEWMLTSLYLDHNKRIQFFNKNIYSAKTTRTFTDKIKTWIIDMISNYHQVIEDANDISNILSWCLKNADDLSILKMILSKVPKDDDSKALLMRTSECILYTAQNNKYNELKMLLNYLNGFIMPLLECDALIKSIDNGNVQCVDIILQSIKIESVKDHLIEAATPENENALMRAIRKKSKKIIEIILKNHSNIDSILGDAFIFIMQKHSFNEQIAEMLLQKATNRSAVLNHKDERNNPALFFGVEQEKPDCLQFLINELANDFEAEDINEKKHDDEDESKHVHPMYLATNIFGNNVFHCMFGVKCSLNNVKILESALNKYVIHKQLLSRNINGQLPIYRAFLIVGVEVLQWILNQFEDPMQKYRMITQRNKYHSSLLFKSAGYSSNVIEETKPFMAQVIAECMEQIDFNNLEFATIKDVFQHTITWKYSKLQSIILSKLDHTQHNELYNRDNMVTSDGYNPMQSIIKANDPKMCAVLLSSNVEYKWLMTHAHDGTNILTHCASYARGGKVIRDILDKCAAKQQPFLAMIAEKPGTAGGWGETAMDWIYGSSQSDLAEIVNSFLPEDMMHIPLLYAAKNDMDCKWIPSLWSKISSKDIKDKVLHAVTAEGETVLRMAMIDCNRKPIEYIISHLKQQDDLLLIKPDNKQNKSPLSIISTKNEFYDIFENVFSRLTFKNKLNELLQRNFDGHSVLTQCNNNKEIAKVVNDFIAGMAPKLSMNNLNEDINIIFPLFEFAIKSKNIDTIRIILDKTSKSIQNKLLINYENGRTWNVLKQLMTKDAKDREIFEFLMRYIENPLPILKDEANPSCNTKYQLLRNCCTEGHLEYFEQILSVFDDHKEDRDQYMQSFDEQHTSLLMWAAAYGFSNVAAFILQRIKDDSMKLKILNTPDDDHHRIFIYLKSSRCKDLVKATVINILKNIKTNHIDSQSFIPYFHWLCREGDIDSIKQLLHVFDKDKQYINVLLKAPSAQTTSPPLHIACSYNNTELLRYLLEFVQDKQQIKDLLSFQNIQGYNPLMYTVTKNDTECFSLVLSMLKSNKKLLSEIIRTTNNANETCIDLEMKNDKIVCCKSISECDIDEETLKCLLLSAVKQSKINFVEQLMPKINAKKLFDYVDSNGCNALFFLLSTGNTNITKHLLKEFDKSDQTEISELVNYKNYQGQNLMHAACKSANIYCGKLVLEMCQFFQHYKSELLLCPDVDGNNPLHIYLNNVTNKKCIEIKDYITWYLSNIKRQRDKLAVISRSNLNHIIPLNCKIVKEQLFGAILFEDIIANIHCNNVVNIEQWSRIMHVAIACTHNSLSLMKLVLSKYVNDEDKIHLLSVKNHVSQNAFYAAFSDVEKLLFVLSFIDESNNQLLLEPSCSAQSDGRTVIHKAIYLNVSGTMLLAKFVSRTPILSLTEDNNETVLYHTVGHQNSVEMLKELTADEICQLFCDNISDSILFSYFEDHSDELIPKLLWKTTRDINATSLMEVIRDADTKAYIFNAMVSYIKTLNDDDRLKLLTATDCTGDSALHICARKNDNTEYVNVILSLFPTKQSKENAILSTNYCGETPIMTAFRFEKVWIAYIFWKNVENVEMKLKMINLGCSSFKIIDTKHNLKDWVKKDFKNIKNKYIDDILSLITLFKLAALQNDVQFAKLILSKIDVNSKEKILQFVTTKLMSQKKQCCLHLAAYSKLGEMMEILFDLLKNIEKYDINALLLNEEIICDENNATPLSIACSFNNPQIIKSILLRIKNKKSRLHLIKLETIYTVNSTNKNYKNKKDREYSRNAVLICCSGSHVECLNQLSLTASEMKQIIQCKTNKNKTIYSYIKNTKTYQHLATNYKMEIGFDQSSHKDVNGETMFQTAVSQSDCDYRYVEWLLNRCTNEEKLKLIYDYNEEHINALDVAATAEVKFILIRTIKNIISSQKKVTDVESTIIPIFLWSLKKGKIELCKWLLSRLHNVSDKSKVINGEDQFGRNTVAAVCKGGQMVSLQFLLSNKLFNRESIFKRDNDGLTAIHYACFTTSNHSISCLNTIISLYMETGKSMVDLMFITDDFGNIPFDYIIRKCGIGTDLAKWILTNCLKDVDDNMKIYRIRMMILFNKNKEHEIALSEQFFGAYNLEVTTCIRQYFESTKIIDDSNLHFAASSLLYLGENNWNVLKLILSKVHDEDIKHKLFSFTDCNNNNILIRICWNAPSHIMDWYLSELIPNDHPCLLTKNISLGETAFKGLLNRGYIAFAHKLLNKISDKAKKLQLIQMKDVEDKTVLDYAKEKNIQPVCDWIQTQLQAAMH